MYVCMYVCMYVYIYIYIYTHTHAHTTETSSDDGKCKHGDKHTLSKAGYLVDSHRGRFNKKGPLHPVLRGGGEETVD